MVIPERVDMRWLPPGLFPLWRVLPVDLRGAARLLCAGVALALAVRPVDDPDYWWHVRVGQWIAAHLALPPNRLLTFNGTDATWYDHEYLSEVVLGLIDRYGGTAAAALLFGLLAWSGLLLAASTIEAKRRNPLVEGAALLLAGLTAMPVIGARMQVITVFFLAVTMRLIWSDRDRPNRRILWLVPLTALWANLHGGWLIGPAMALLFAVGRLAAPGQPNRVRFRGAARLGLVATAMTSAALLTPYGLAGHLRAFGIVSSQVQQENIVEWHSPDFHRLEMRAFELAILLVGLGLVLARPRLEELLVAAAATVLALQSVRHVSLFAVLTLPVLVRCWSTAHARWRSGSAPPPRLGRLPGLAIAASACLLAAGLSLRNLTAEPAVQAAGFPVAAAAWVDSRPDLGPRMLNFYSWGGYLAYRLDSGGERPVYIYGKGNPADDALIQRYLDLTRLTPGWRQKLAEDRIDWVILPPSSPLVAVLRDDPGWEVGYEDEVAAVLIRR